MTPTILMTGAPFGVRPFFALNLTTCDIACGGEVSA